MAARTRSDPKNHVVRRLFRDFLLKIFILKNTPVINHDLTAEYNPIEWLWFMIQIDIYFRLPPNQLGGNVLSLSAFGH